MNNIIFPRALEIAAKTFAKKPAVLGEIVIEIAGYSEKGKALSEVQRYIVAECREEIEDKAAAQAARREAARTRKARQRANENKTKGGKQ